jgi:hypothetical protein
VSAGIHWTTPILAAGEGVAGAAQKQSLGIVKRIEIESTLNEEESA